MIQKSPFLDFNKNKNSGGANRYFGENILNVGRPEYRLFLSSKKYLWDQSTPKKIQLILEKASLVRRPQLSFHVHRYFCLTETSISSRRYLFLVSEILFTE